MSLPSPVRQASLMSLHVAPSVATTPVHAAPAQTSAVAQLIGLNTGFKTHAPEGHSPFELPPSDLDALVKLLQDAYGFAYYDDQKKLLSRRVGWRMRVNQVYNLNSYKAILMQNPAELPALRKSLTIHITDFFRDPSVYYAIESEVLPLLFDHAGPEGIQIGISPCDEGGDVYSMAMLCETLKVRNRISTPVHVHAFDNNTSKLATAQKGFYPHLITIDLSPFCLHTYFDANNEGYQVNAALRKNISFELGDIAPPPVSPALDLILATPASLQRGKGDTEKLMETYFRTLKSGGFLVLPSSVRPEEVATYFVPRNSERGIYMPRHETRETFSFFQGELLHTHLALQSTLDDIEVERDRIEEERVSLQEMAGSIQEENARLHIQNTQLETSVKQLEEIISLCHVGVLYLNDELCIELFTPEAAELFRLNRNDIGRPLSHLESPFTWNVYDAVSKVLRSRVSMEYERESRNQRWYRVHLNPRIEEDHVIGIACSFLDITETRRASEWDRFKAGILHQMQDTVVVTNKNRRVTYLNKAAIQRFGLYHQHKTGFPIDNLNETLWRSRQDEQQAYAKLKKDGSWKGELLHIASNGRKSRVFTSMYVLRDETEQEIGMLTVIRDTLEDGGDPSTEFLQSIIDDLAERCDALDEALDDASDSLTGFE